MWTMTAQKTFLLNQCVINSWQSGNVSCNRVVSASSRHTSGSEQRQPCCSALVQGLPGSQLFRGCGPTLGSPWWFGNRGNQADQKSKRQMCEEWLPSFRSDYLQSLVCFSCFDGFDLDLCFFVISLSWRHAFVFRLRQEPRTFPCEEIEARRAITVSIPLAFGTIWLRYDTDRYCRTDTVFVNRCQQFASLIHICINCFPTQTLHILRHGVHLRFAYQQRGVLSSVKTSCMIYIMTYHACFFCIFLLFFSILFSFPALTLRCWNDVFQSARDFERNDVKQEGSCWPFRAECWH